MIELSYLESPPVLEDSFSHALSAFADLLDGGDGERDHQDEWDKCAADPCYFINTYCKTYDPRLIPEDPFIPFKLFPIQEEFVRWLQDREINKEDGLGEKSRDCGFSFLCGAYALHGWLFRKGFSVGIGSRTEDDIDQKGNRRSIFEKIRVMLYSLPPFLIPKGFKEKVHDNHMRLVNPENGATITGQAGENIGRGDRQTIYFIDEAAFLENPKSVEMSLSQTSNCRIWISTPNGPAGTFFEKRHSGDVEVFTFHWKNDPRKNAYVVLDAEENIITIGNGPNPPAPPPGGRVVYAWYEGEKKRLGNPVVVAQELDIDYHASIEGILIPGEWVRAAVNLALYNLDGTPYTPRDPKRGGYDIAEGGGDLNVLISRQGPLVDHPVDWNGLNTSESAWKARDEGKKLGIAHLNYDAVGIGAGVRGMWESSETPLPFKAVGIRAGETPSDRTFWGDKPASELFVNIRAEMAWALRCRFEKAFEYVTQGVKHPPSEMISIPNHPKLIGQLSVPIIERTETGKIRLESKEKMKKRGVKSPDFFDALCYAFREQPVSWATDESTLAHLRAS